MSKSLNNFLMLHEALEIVRPEALRMLMLQTHYRSPLVFGDQRLSEADAALTRIQNAVKNVDWLLANASDGAAVVDAQVLRAAIDTAREDFISAMDDDFNAPEALGAVFGLVAAVNTATAEGLITTADAAIVSEARDVLVELMGVFGIDVCASQVTDEGVRYPDAVLSLAAQLAAFDGTDKTAAVQALLDARAAARKEKNWALADAVRNGLSDLGFTIEDTAQGARVSFNS